MDDGNPDQEWRLGKMGTAAHASINTIVTIVIIAVAITCVAIVIMDTVSPYGH